MQAFRHNDWNIFKKSHRTMPMVSITYNKVLSDVWSHPELVLAVGGESDERFVKYCRSWERLTIMQVLIPIFALNSAKTKTCSTLCIGMALVVGPVPMLTQELLARVP